MKLIKKNYTLCSNGEYEWKFIIELSDRFQYTVYIVYSPHYINDGNYYATGILRGNEVNKRYGFSNYFNTLKYVIKAIYKDLLELDSGRHILDEHHWPSEEEFKELKKFELG
jgi:hypothetical protein